MLTQTKRTITVEKAAENYWTATVEEYGKEFENAKKVVAKGTLKKSQMTPEAIEEHKKIAHEIWDEVAKRDAASENTIQLIKEWKGVK